MHHCKPGLPGELVLDRGRLWLPMTLLVGNDEAVAATWDAWTPAGDGVCVSMGKAGPLVLAATLKVGAFVRIEVAILNDSEAPVELRRGAWSMVVDQPRRVSLLPECGIETIRPWDFVLTHETLTDDGRVSRWLRLDFESQRAGDGDVCDELTGDESMHVGSDDPLRYADGLVRIEPAAVGEAEVRLDWHRVEPKWDYNGLVSMRPLHGLWIHEGQTRVMSLVLAWGDEATMGGVIGAAASEGMLHGDTPSLPTAKSASPLCWRGGRVTFDRSAAWAMIDRVFITHGPYADLYAGGYDHRNRRQLEPHVCRAEYGEFLMHEALRLRDDRLWAKACQFASRFEQVCVNRSTHPVKGGAVRGRYGDNVAAHQIRSMRGAAFFWDMADAAGVERYRDVATGIADYLARSFPWTNARQGAAVRDLAYMHRVTGDGKYAEAAGLIVETLERAQTADGGWYEYWDEDYQAFRYDPPGHHGGEWTPRSTQKPEMASYNVNGLLDAAMVALPGVLPAGMMAMVAKAAAWLADVQHARGAWTFPSADSVGLYGYGLYLDAAAMLKAGQAFGEKRFTAAGLRAMAFGDAVVEERGFLPQLIGVADVDQVECSLTCFYALEAFAYAESIGLSADDLIGV